MWAARDVARSPTCAVSYRLAEARATDPAAEGPGSGRPMTRESTSREALLGMRRDLEPRLEARRRAAAELMAVATLRNVVSAQAQLQASGKIDVDEDGTGEYGGFREMSGAVAGRMRTALRPPILPDDLGALNAHGEATQGGYLFRIYLPDRQGSPVGEPGSGFAADRSVHPEAAEALWCAYAWPAESADTPAPTYFVNQAGTVLSTRDARYAGPGRGPVPLAAFAHTDTLAGVPAEGTEGQDGNVWKLVN